MSRRQDCLPPFFLLKKKPPRGEAKTGAGSPNSDGVMLWRLAALIRRYNASWVTQPFFHRTPVLFA
jgi:hypothetical protein